VDGFLLNELHVEGLTNTTAIPSSLVNVTNDGHFHITDLRVQNVNSNAAGPVAILNLASSENGEIDNPYIQGNGTAATAVVGFNCNASAGFTIVNPLFSNNGTSNMSFLNCGQRTPTTQTVTVVGGTDDECGTPPCINVTTNSTVGFNGMAMYNPGSGSSISIDGTSSAYFFGVGCGSFNSAGNSACASIASGGLLVATGSHLRGNGTTSAITGPAGATFVDDGSNTFQNWTSTTCNNSSPADNTSGCSGKPAMTMALAYSGGINPKSSLTHSPNTCQLTITPIVNSTTYTLCNAFLDQNYQIEHIKASSVATTSCTTAPIITISDGTNSATLTLTTAKASWDSAVDTSTGINNLVASGNTLTFKYDVAAASVCATPPTNLAVTATMQSVLNF
jgi:hypothetical protein